MMVLSVIFYVISAGFIGLGFYKILVYDSTGYMTTNAYVGGDAYNYIINANYAIGYFVLALLFTVLATGLLIVNRLGEKK